MMLNLSSINLNDHEQFYVQYPGSIQSHGVLLVIDIQTLNIIQVSENTQDFLGIKPRTLLGKPLNYLLSSKTITNILGFVDKNNHEYVEKIKLKRNPKKLKFRGIFHTIQDSLILELEPLSPEDNKSSIEIYNLFRNSIINIELTNNLEEILQIITQEVRKITQFDRVLIYRFEFDSSGVVLAEDKREDIESYLGLHYPAYDIPTPARQFYSSNWLRIIPNVFYQPIPIIPRQHPLRNEELDLSHAVLRSVFPCHVQYLKNMGVSASMSISIMNESKLWGLIACHHYSPKYISYETRKICEFLGQFISAKLLYKQEEKFREYRRQIQQIQSLIRDELNKNYNSISNVFNKNKGHLINLTHSQGLAICLDEKISLIGKTPTQEQIEDLIINFLTPQKIEIFYTDSLEKNYPKAAEFQNKACGILAISIFLTNSNYHIIWFRTEQAHEVKWAGNPDDFTVISDEHNMTQ